MKTTGPRRVKPRLWSSLAIAGTAAAMAGPAPAQASPITGGPERVWLAASEGGEGGESGAVNASPDVAYLSSLAQIDGHLRIGMALYRAGKAAEAADHMDRPDSEIYQILSSELAEHGKPGFEAELTALADAAAAGKPLAEVEAAYAAALRPINEGLDHGAQEPHVMFEAIVDISRNAADDYARGVVEGKISELGEYQDAWAYMQVAHDMSVRLAASTDPVVKTAAEKIITFIDATDAAFAGLDPAGAVPADASLLYAAAAKIELAAYKVK